MSLRWGYGLSKAGLATREWGEIEKTLGPSRAHSLGRIRANGAFGEEKISKQDLIALFMTRPAVVFLSTLPIDAACVYAVLQNGKYLQKVEGEAALRVLPSLLPLLLQPLMPEGTVWKHA